MKLTEILRDLGSPIVVYGGLARWLGLEESIFLNHVLYWMTGPDSWAYRTIQEIEAVTSLSKRVQERVRKNLIEEGLLYERRNFETHQIFYQVDEEKLNVQWECRRKGPSGEGADETQPSRMRTATNPRVRAHNARGRDKTNENSKHTIANSESPTEAKLEYPPKKSFEQIAASRLEALLRLHRQVTGPVKIKKWEKDILWLMKSQPKAEIKAVIIWLEKSGAIRDQYTPHFFSASSFASKFPALLACKARWEKDNPTLVPVEELNEDEQWLYEHLTNLSWPKGSDQLLATCLHRSYVRLLPWYHKWIAFQRTLRGDDLALAETVTSYYYTGGVRAILHLWFMNVHRSVRDWENWNGDLSRFVWDPKHPLNIKQMEQVSMEWCARSDAFAKLYARFDES
jgi:hypothetical protein